MTTATIAIIITIIIGFAVRMVKSQLNMPISVNNAGCCKGPLS
jgi:hypothetical protein